MRLLQEYIAFARERHLIYERRAKGLPRPWTKDAVLQAFRFCNVYREYDKTTRWFAANVRDRLSDPAALLTSTALFRWFNTIESGLLLGDALLLRYDRALVERALRPSKNAGVKLWTGAYLVKSPPGVDKLTGLLDCMDALAGDAESLVADWPATLQESHKALLRYPYLGRFMAYELVTDLRHTQLLAGAPDKLTWASAGPGCARGLGWIVSGDPGQYSYASDTQQELMNALMQEVLAAVRSCWPARWPEWEMREVEHVCCEFDKWCRATYSGQRLKRKF